MSISSHHCHSSESPSLDLDDPEVRANPYPTYRWFREHDPVHRLEPKQPHGTVRYLLTRWDDVERCLKTPSLKRTIHPMALWNQPMEQVPPAFQTYARITRAWPLFQDPPQHAQLRRPVNRILDESAGDTSGPVLGTILNETLRTLSQRPSFDAVEDFARQIPLSFDLNSLGIEGHAVSELGDHLSTVALALGNTFDECRISAASRSLEILTQWIVDAVRRKRSNPSRCSAPFLDRLLALEDAGLIQGGDQITATAILLMQAAQDTTSALIANGIWLLLRHAEVVTWMLEDETRMPLVVDEVLRFESPVQQITRHASMPLEIGGVTVAMGEGVSLLLGAANRDPEVFNEPETFDPTKHRARNAAFGFGPHSCPGTQLAKRIARECWWGLFTRFPRLHLDSAPTRWRPTVTFRTLSSLPVLT